MDIQSFERMYKTFQPGLVNFAYFYLKNEQDAIDLVQELFLNLWEKKASQPIPDNPKAYLMMAVKNRCNNKLTRNKSEHHPIDSLEEVFISQDDTSSKIQTQQTKDSIDSIINKLPEKCKKIFILSRFEHLSYKDIASRLNISVKTVENQIGNAIKLLRSSLR